MAETAPSRDAVLAALERVLTWPELARSQQLGSFLRYIVQRTLDGEQHAIKAYAIAVDVFGRPADFDPQADPIVRVQARRLRSLLSDYYALDGSAETVQIRLPTGRYVPEFVEAGPVILPEASAPEALPPAPDAGGPDARLWLGIGALTLGLAILVLGAWAWLQANRHAPGGGRPSITIVELANLAAAQSEAPLVSGFAVELVTDLEQFETIDARYGGVAADTSQLATDFVLTGVVRGDGGVVQYSVLLTDLRSSAVMWNKNLSVPAATAHQPGVLDTVSQSISMVLGSARGPLHAPARALLAADEANAPPLGLYRCRVLFDLHRETGDTSDADRALACLSQLPQTEKASAMALAMGATLRAETRPVTAASAGAGVFYQSVMSDLERAVEAAPVSSFAWEQLGHHRESRGLHALALQDYGSAIQLNPANTDALAAYGRLLAFTGATEDARAPALKALQGAPDPPAWYHGGPALLAIADKIWLRAAGLAQTYEPADRTLGAVLALVAGHEAGDAGVVNRYLPQVLDMPAFRSAGILPRLRKTIIGTALLNTIGASLLAAGVPQAALNQPF